LISVFTKKVFQFHSVEKGTFFQLFQPNLKKDSFPDFPAPVSTGAGKLTAHASSSLHVQSASEWSQQQP